jgi:ATP-binding cassette, subfamily B, bacterial CvaB/MchF/RaxB
MKELVGRLSFGVASKLPVILQTEATECGLACLAMVAGFHGYHCELGALRRRFPVSLKGVTLATLMRVAAALDLMTRPLKLDIRHLPQLRLPCVLHWDFNHFVVLKEVRGNCATIHDPAHGERRLCLEELSKSFTGVALECWPGTEFKPQDTRKRLRLRDLMGHVSGLGRSLGQALWLAVALEFFTVLTPLFQRWIVDDVIVSADRDLLAVLALGFGLLLLAQQAVAAIRGWVLMYLGTVVNIQWCANVFAHLLSLPVPYFEKRHLGDVVSRFGSIDTIQRTLTTSFLEAILDGVMTIITLALMFIYSSQLAWIAVAAMSLYGIARWVWFAPLRRAREDQIVHVAKQQTHFLETVRGIKVLKLFARMEERRSSWLALLVEQINAELRTQKLTLLYRSLNGLLFGLENLLILAWGARLVIDGDFTVGLLIAFLAYKAQFDTRVSSLIDKFVDVKMLALQGERLADIVFTAPEITRSTASHAPSEIPPTLEVTNVRFRYADHEPYVLDGVSLRVGARESVAIVGPSGGGKTTLLNLLLGIHAPSEGEVRIGGVAIEELGLDSIRQMIGTVLQDDVLFAGSIADNISFFDPQADQSWIEECAQRAAIHADIIAMPMGYNTLVGDMGTVLSGGQKQRVLLARALYKRPKILFLDEATSHLDLACERAVNAAIQSLNITRVIVAHRPETISSAERVIAIEGGRITSDGARGAPRVPGYPPMQSSGEGGWRALTPEWRTGCVGAID